MIGSPFRVAAVIPVFNDWQSVSILLERISAIYQRGEIQFSIVVVDDGSTDPVRFNYPAVGGDSCVRSLRIIRLVTNLGHQRAIAVGLVQVSRCTSFDAVLVM